MNIETDTTRLLKLLDAASEGPWQINEPPRCRDVISTKCRGLYITRDVGNGRDYVARMDGSTHAAFEQQANAELIPLAVNWLRANRDLVEERNVAQQELALAHATIENLKTRLAACEGALEQYHAAELAGPVAHVLFTKQDEGTATVGLYDDTLKSGDQLFAQSKKDEAVELLREFVEGRFALIDGLKASEHPGRAAWHELFDNAAQFLTTIDSER